MSKISLLSLNIERSRHLDTVVQFLKAKKPDVVAFQECMEYDIPIFEKALDAKCFFTPLNISASRKDEKEGIEGCAIFAKEFISSGAEYYAGEHDPIPRHTEDKLASILRIAKALSHVEIEKDDVRFYVATTHFTWSPGGEVTDEQRRDLQALLEKMKTLPELILAGDFNAPRGRAIWDTLAAKYKDNIPAHYTSSIDPMHRAGPLPYVVDGLFTTPQYMVSDVELHEGISDHKAVTAIISKP